MNKFSALMGLLMLTTAMACCGKKCQTTRKRSASYEKLEDTTFEDIHQPLMQQTSKKRKEEPLIQTNITTTFI